MKKQKGNYGSIMSELEIIVTTMYSSDRNIYDKMNISTDLIIANQGNETLYASWDNNNNNVKLISTQTRGVGNNRNIGFAHATANIILFADDDQVFLSSYKNDIIDEFNKYPKADAIIFNVTHDGKQSNKFFKKTKKIHFNDVRHLGVWGLAIKRNFLEYNNLFFSTLFGGGAKYSCGEDTLFFKHIFKAKGYVLCSNKVICNIVNNRESTWFKGYNEKYFYDKGVLYALLFGYLARLITIYNIFKYRKNYLHFGIKKAIMLSFLGIKYSKTGLSFSEVMKKLNIK